MSPPTVLILDDELGFLFALSEELTQRQIALLPARTAREARTMIGRFQLGPDLLVINCSRPGACGLAEGLAKEHGDMQTVAMVSPGHRCQKCASRIAAELRDPEDTLPGRIRHCADVIERLVRRRTQRAGGG